MPEEFVPKPINQARESELAVQWKKTKDPKVLAELMERLQPLIKKRMSALKGAPGVPEPVLEATIYKAIRGGLDRYDPSKAQLGTYLNWVILKANREVYKHQNFGKMTEPRIRKITPYKAALERVRRSGQPQTPEAISKELKWPVKEVQRMQRELRSDLTTSRFPVDPASKTQSQTSQVLQLVRPSLAQKDQEIFDHLVGYGEKRQVSSTGTLAKMFKVSPSYVSRVKGRIAVKIEDATKQVKL